MEKLTFDDLPKAVSQLGIQLDAIHQMLAQRIEPQPTPPTDKLLSVQEAAAFLRLTVPTVYSKVSRCELPAMKRGNRLHFSQAELIGYLKSGKKKSHTEINAKAEAYLANGRKEVRHG
ncbi:MAG: helix-turn-helix domain-containing protein [Rikenellaceae bacterium]|nr:helix-turn-helix domain-containing protein [Rikenellaceae bacterium]MCL2692069.1 helix-turn-helix domain-containing protein [Rikenellaceae bacterium]